jgi:hypothetical protein
MENQCLICLKQLNSKAALKGHTGTDDPTLRKPHACGKCDKFFCSQTAMEQHRDGPAHPTFSCNVCNKSFGSKQAVADHQKSLRHSAGNVRLHYALSGRECCSNSHVTCRLPPPRPCLIHLRYLSSSSLTTRTTEPPWPTNITVVKMPGHMALMAGKIMIRTGRFAIRTAGGADIVQRA